jgi:hypothetical protein
MPGGCLSNADLEVLPYTLVCVDEHSNPATLVRLQQLPQLQRTFTTGSDSVFVCVHTQWAAKKCAYHISDV